MKFILFVVWKISLHTKWIFALSNTNSSKLHNNGNQNFVVVSFENIYMPAFPVDFFFCIPKSDYIFVGKNNNDAVSMYFTLNLSSDQVKKRYEFWVWKRIGTKFSTMVSSKE